ncbi:MAG: DegV family protein [Butyricicoccus pullicaecorum]|nr:DegV family protein [Butyricicoccus pullicaecorum]MDO4668807.1 DegV family protein [Butyricicoccus pullicaecorum]
MEKIHIFCDSAADIPRELVQKYEIDIVPEKITHNGKTFREFYDMTPEEYWDLLEASEEIPTTAQITPAEVMASYEKALADGCTHVLGIIMNAAGSGGYQSCCIARSMFYEAYGMDMEIELIDSESYTYIFGQVVLHACEMRDAGDAFCDIVHIARARLKRCEAVLGVYTLKHLKKSGRISGGAAFVGEALGLKPVSLVKAGAVTVIDKARGEKNLISKVLEQVARRAVHPESQKAVLLYGKIAPEKIDEMEKGLLEKIGFEAVERRPIGISVITNTGPQAFAVAYHGEQRALE